MGGAASGICTAFTPGVRGDIDPLNCTNPPTPPPPFCHPQQRGALYTFHQAIFISVDLGMRGASRPRLYEPAVNGGKVHSVAWGGLPLKRSPSIKACSLPALTSARKGRICPRLLQTPLRDEPGCVGGGGVGCSRPWRARRARGDMHFNLLASSRGAFLVAGSQPFHRHRGFLVELRSTRLLLLFSRISWGFIRFPNAVKYENAPTQPASLIAPCSTRA